jgi:uncharacterized membrane protein
MSYDEKTDKMDWKEEYSWMTISAISGIVLSLIFIYFDRFPTSNLVTIFSVCCIGFYTLSILIRIQNHRGKVITGKTGTDEKILKFVFPIVGFGLGLALIFF